MTRDERIAHYRAHIYPQVVGWLGPRVWEAMTVVGDLHERNVVNGDLAEFGVYHGKFLFLIDCLRGLVDNCYAVDLFEDQHLVREAGLIDLGRFDENRKEFGVDCIKIKRDTLSVRATDLPPLRFLSIDGGHSPACAYNDLVLAQELMVSGGIIALDDFFNPRFPGVAEGFYRFMDRVNRRLAPVLYWQNKLWMTTISEHRMTLDAFQRGHDDFVRAPIEPICGYDCLIGEWPGH